MNFEKNTHIPEMNKRMHVFFSGRVQGVGFRFTAEHIARGLHLKGWVKNLSDGRVELVAEGLEEDLRAMIEKIEDRFRDYIRQRQIFWESYQGEFSSFGIRFF